MYIWVMIFLTFIKGEIQTVDEIHLQNLDKVFHRYALYNYGITPLYDDNPDNKGYWQSIVGSNLEPSDWDWILNPNLNFSKLKKTFPEYSMWTKLMREYKIKKICQ